MLLPPSTARTSDPTADRDDDAPDDRERPSRLVKTGTVCAVLLGAMLLASVGVIVWSPTSADSPTYRSEHKAAPAAVPATGTVPAATTSSSPTSSTGSAGSASPVSPAPGQVTWLQVGIGGLPFSATAGPSAVRAGVPSGFAHTRAGSVMAAIQILGRLSWAAQTSTSMHAVATASTTPSAQALRALTYGPPGDPSLIPAVAGFQIVTYAPSQAVVNLALRFNGALRVVPAAMQWTAGADSSGDWKLAGAPGPLSDTSWAAIDDLTGYVLFSGQPTAPGN